MHAKWLQRAPENRRFSRLFTAWCKYRCRSYTYMEGHKKQNNLRGRSQQVTGGIVTNLVLDLGCTFWRVVNKPECMDLSGSTAKAWMDRLKGVRVIFLLKKRIFILIISRPFIFKAPFPLEWGMRGKKQVSIFGLSPHFFQCVCVRACVSACRPNVPICFKKKAPLNKNKLNPSNWWEKRKSKTKWIVNHSALQKAGSQWSMELKAGWNTMSVHNSLANLQYLHFWHCKNLTCQNLLRSCATKTRTGHAHEGVTGCFCTRAKRSSPVIGPSAPACASPVRLWFPSV